MAAAPPAPSATVKIDPTPRPGDITSFEQAKARSKGVKDDGPQMQGDMEDIGHDPVKKSGRLEAEPPGPMSGRRNSPEKSNNPKQPDKQPEKKEPPKKPEKKPEPEKKEEPDYPDDESGAKKKAADAKKTESELEDYSDSEDESVDPKSKPELEEDDEEGKQKKDDDQNEEEDAPEDEEDIDQKIEKLGPLPAVRKAHKAALKTIKAHEKSLRESNNKVIDLQQKLKEATEGALAVEQREAYEGRISDYESKLRTIDYKQSAEFKEKYVDPLAGAWKSAMDDLEEMSVDDGSGNFRKATPDDFRRVLNMPDMQSALREARALFGPDVANMIIAHRQAVRKKSAALDLADKDAAEASLQVAKKNSEKNAAERVRLQKLYTKQSEDFVERWGGTFGDREGDDEGNELLKKGWDQVNDVVANKQEVAEDVRIRNLLKVRYQAAVFFRNLRDIKSLKTEVEDLKKQLKAFESSEPTKGRELGSNGKSEDEWVDNLDKYADKDI